MERRESSFAGVVHSSRAAPLGQVAGHPTNLERLPNSVPVYFATLDEPRARERTLTENVSPHGARVLAGGLDNPAKSRLLRL